VEHKHLLVNATFKSSPFQSVSFTESWIRSIVSKIDMELLYQPIAVRCNDAHNEGISAFCLITTSHIALHSWDEVEPNLVQLDIYSCKNFSRNLILDEFEKFSPLHLGCKYLDRSIKNTKGWQMGSDNIL
jgi:S-adenosylmethionine/arginine decarboxylase-like enzyme